MICFIMEIFYYIKPNSFYDWISFLWLILAFIAAYLLAKKSVNLLILDLETGISIVEAHCNHWGLEHLFVSYKMQSTTENMPLLISKMKDSLARAKKYKFYYGIKIWMIMNFSSRDAINIAGYQWYDHSCARFGKGI